MVHIPQSHEKYRHFKGKEYEIITLAKHSETDETLVIYQALYGEYQVYARPLASFMEPVNRKKYPDATQQMRFELIGANENTLVTAGGEALMPETEAVSQEVVSQKEVLQDDMSTQDDFQEELQLDPGVMAFLDATSIQDRIDILIGMKSRLTNDMITTMAYVLDLEIDDGDVVERYEELKNCLQTISRYEIDRLRR